MSPITTFSYIVCHYALSFPVLANVHPGLVSRQPSFLLVYHNIPLSSVSTFPFQSHDLHLHTYLISI